jgi:hypothetical protein
MFNDETVQQWILETGTATSFTFLVLGNLTEEQLNTLVKGLVFALEIQGKDYEVAVFEEEIDEEKAVAWNTFQGTSISIVLRGNKIAYEKDVRMVIESGLDYLKFKYEYLGKHRSDSYV